MPELSGSLDSCTAVDVLEFDNDSASSSTSSTSEPLPMSRPVPRRQDSLNSRSRGRERHITSGDLEKMVITIKEKKNLEPLPSHDYLASSSEENEETPETQQTPESPEAPATSAASPHRIVESLSSDSASVSSIQAPSSESSCTSERSTTSVVKGFSPAHISSSYRSANNLNPHLPSSIPDADIVAINAKPALKKKTPMFMLVSSDESEPSHSMEREKVVVPKKANFYLGASSNEDESLPHKSALTAATQKQPKKQTSFKEEVATRIIQDGQPFDDDVFETDDEDDVDESAIDDDDDDSSDWEDSNEESNNVSIDEKTFFQRVDSKLNLTSRPSLLTLALNKDPNLARFETMSKSTSALQRPSTLQRSRTTSPSGPSLATSPDEPLMMKQANLRPIAENSTLAPRAQPIIMTTTNTTPHQLALSPRTTRRNMLSTELPPSLRQHLLHERQQKSQTVNAVLKRRHTAHDVANLKQYPEKVHINKSKLDQDSAGWNQYFSQGLGEYHSKGW